MIDVAERLDISYAGAHRALVDCKITKKAYDKMKSIICETIGVDNFIQLFKKVRYPVKYEHLNPDEIVPNEENPLFGKVCVITGVLKRFSREEALKAIERIGGLVGERVTKKTNFLILGNNDYCRTIKDGKSSKQKKAEDYKLNGQDIEIIPETVFYDMLGE